MKDRDNKCNSREKPPQEVADPILIALREVLLPVNLATEIAVVETAEEEETFLEETRKYFIK